MRSTGILILLFIVISCYADDDPVAAKIANSQVSAILNAIETKNQTELMTLFSTTTEDLGNLEKFIDIMQGLELKVWSSKTRERSIHSGIGIAGKASGDMDLIKSTESSTGWTISSMKFLIPNRPGRYSKLPRFVYCDKGLFKCFIDILHKNF